MVSATFSPVFTGTVDLSTIDAVFAGLEDAGDLAGDALDVGEIDAAIGLRRRGHGDEDDLRMIDAVLDGIGEAQALGGDVAVHEVFEAGLVDRDLAGLQRIDFALVVIDADDVVADFGEAGAGDEADITGANDAEIHFSKKTVCVNAGVERVSPRKAAH